MKIQGDNGGVQDSGGWSGKGTSEPSSSEPNETPKETSIPSGRADEKQGGGAEAKPEKPVGPQSIFDRLPEQSKKNLINGLKQFRDNYRDDLKREVGRPRHSAGSNQKPGLVDHAKDASKDGLKKGAAALGKKAAEKTAPPAAAATGGYMVGAKVIGAVTGAIRGLLNSAPVAVVTQTAAAVTHAVNSVLSFVTTALGFKAVTSVVPTVVLTVGITAGATDGILATYHTVDSGNNCALQQSARNGSITSDMRNKIIELAKTQLGVPYVWGGTAWNKGMDCSGFVQNVFKRVGISLPRTAAQQSTVAQSITKSQAKPGDLVFWGSRGSSYHVAIYMGNGKIIAEPTTGEVTKIQPLWGSYWFGALDMVTAQDGSKNTSAGGSAIGAYTQKGTQGYDNAKAIFDDLTKNDGFSGAGAAGAVGNAARESGMDPAKPGSVSSGVYGLFQWSGWFNTVNGDRWRAAPQGKVATMKNELALMDIELSGSHLKAKKSVGHAQDPIQAAGLWAELFEGLRGGASNAQYNAPVTNAAANWAYKEFGGQNIQANDGLLGSTFTDIASGNANTASDDQSNPLCKDIQESSGDTSTEKSPLDGQGSVSEPTGTYWDAKHVPKDVKKYIHDPKSAKLSYGKSSGWSNPGGSDTDFALSYFRALWGIPNVSIKNGASAAGDVAKKISGDAKNVSSSPQAGAIGSFPANVKGYSGKNGHAFIVEHVLDNGDIIVAEQNVKGYSGSANGTPNTWNYRLISQNAYSKAKATFFSSEGGKYGLNWSK